MRVKIADIELGERHRKDMGNLQALAKSIELHGLLQPIGVTPDKQLVFGERRIRAVQEILGRSEIEAHAYR